MIISNFPVRKVRHREVNHWKKFTRKWNWHATQVSGEQVQCLSGYISLTLYKESPAQKKGFFYMQLPKLHKPKQSNICSVMAIIEIVYYYQIPAQTHWACHLQSPYFCQGTLLLSSKFCVQKPCPRGSAFNSHK